MLSGFLTVHSYFGSDTRSIYSLIGGWWRYTPRCILRMSLCRIVLGMELE